MIDIYYAEDDDNIAQTVKEYLGKREYRVYVFPTIEKAKQALKNMQDGCGA